MPGTHPRAFAGGEDDGTQRSVLAHRHVSTRFCLASRLGGEVSNLDLGLQRTSCCLYTTPESLDDSGRCEGSSSWLLVASLFVMGSLIKKRRKRMRKKKHKKLLKKTRWQRRQQGK